MSFKFISNGTDDLGRKYVDIEVVGTETAGANANAAADAIIAKIPFKGARALMVNFSGTTHRQKAGNPRAISAATLKTSLASYAVSSAGVGVRIYGP